MHLQNIHSSTVSADGSNLDVNIYAANAPA